MKLNHYILVNIVAQTDSFINPNRQSCKIDAKKQPQFTAVCYGNKNLPGLRTGPSTGHAHASAFAGTANANPNKAAKIHRIDQTS